MSQQPTVEERLQRLEDLEEIRELFRQYAKRLDRRDFVAWSQLWAKDGEWHGPDMHGVGGPPGVLEMLQTRFGDRPPTGETHVVTNAVIALEGDRAHATSFGLVLRPDGEGRPRTTMIGYYVDDLVREDGRWRFQVRRDYLNLPPYLWTTTLGPPTTWDA